VELTPHVDAIRDDIGALLATDEAATNALARLERAVDASLQLRLLDTLAQAAQELAEQLPAGHVDVRLAGRDVALVYVGQPQEPVPASPSDEDEAGTARITLRLPESLKSKAEEAATREGLSVNAWLVRVIARGVNPPVFGVEFRPGRSGSRITGYAQS
jgi:hypothetical protein